MLSAAILLAFLVTACQIEETHLGPFLRKERIRLLLLAHMQAYACMRTCVCVSIINTGRGYCPELLMN